MERAGKDLVIGRITGVYGIKGWVRVHAFTDPVENFLNYSHLRIVGRGVDKAVTVDRGKRHGKGLLVHIAGVDDRSQAEKYRGFEVVAPESELPLLSEGEFYWHQLQGLRVYSLSGDKQTPPVFLGRVDRLLETGSNDVLVVTPTEDSLDDRERLIPYLPGQVVIEVDLDKQLIEVDWPTDF